MDAGAAGVMCIGGATVDRKYRARDPVRMETSNPVTSTRSFGGVARNVAENVARLGAKASLVSVLGDDDNGRAVLKALEGLGIGTRHVTLSRDRATAEYVAVLQPEGNLAIGLADMAIFDEMTPASLQRAWREMSPLWVFSDCNPPSQTLCELVALARTGPALLAVDAVSTLKVMRLPKDLSGVGILFLNLDEARAYLSLPAAAPEQAAGALLARGVERVVLTLGEGGLVAADRSGLTRIGAVEARIVDATGAGDALIATTLVAMMNGHSFIEAARLGAAAAALTIEDTASVRPDLSFALLETAMSRRAHRAL